MKLKLIERASLVFRERRNAFRYTAFSLLQPAYRKMHPSDVAFIFCKHPVITPLIIDINTRLGVPIHIVRPGEDFSAYRKVIVPNGKWPDIQPTADSIPEEKRIYCEVGFFPQNRNVYFDSEGVHGHSSFRNIELPALASEQQDTLEAFRKYYVGKNFVKLRWDTVDDPSSAPISANDDYNDPFVFVPLQIESDTAFDLCPFECNQDIINAIEAQLPHRRIVFKVHPWDTDNQYTVSAGNTLLPCHNRDLKELIQRCDYVVNCNSTVMLEAMLYGKKCASLGTGFATNHDIALECHDDIDRLRDMEQWEPDWQKVDSFLYQLIARQISVDFYQDDREKEKLASWLRHFEVL